jgi:precorrin-3B synthase
MSARATVQRRGTCPGLSVPMPTGDGLLVRLLPIGTIPLDAFAGLCVAARTHGNGGIEVTSRGSVQIRGLTPASAPRFAAAVAALGIAADVGVPVLTNPLAGIDAGEICDAGLLAAKLRNALAAASIAARLAPKVSVVIDGGPRDLDALEADVRLCAEALDGDAALRVSVGGDGASAVELGTVTPAHGEEAAVRMLDVIARHGRNARARDVLATEGAAPFLDALSSHPALCRASTSDPLGEIKDAAGRHKFGHGGNGVRHEAIGTHSLRDGSLACGIGLSFGHADAQTLESVIEAAAAASAIGVRAAPSRVLMIIGLTPETAPSFILAADGLGFIVRADDPRRRVVACAGAPVCASAHIAARAMAPLIAAAAGRLVRRGLTVHVSGCAKGCAHPAPAALTIVGHAGGCALIANGRAGDRPDDIVPTSDLSEAVARAARAPAGEAHHV